MAGKYFGIPFALSGDRAAIPDAAQPDGSVSFTQGFTLDYELENTDPNYKPVPREETNALYYDITEAIGIVQKQGFADWTIDAAPYPINAFVRHNDIVWRNTIAANSAEPGTDATWVDETISFVDTVNAPVATVAAAATIDLTAAAPNTSQLAISGTGVSINGFTVAEDRWFCVKMTGANTLVNSASLVTGSGANIATAAGDSFLMRSTAANVVEVLCYTRGDAQRRAINAWILFNGTGTVAITDSYGVSSIADLGTASYQVNFNAGVFTNSNYCVASSATRVDAANEGRICSVHTRSTASCRVFTETGGGTAQDCTFISLQFTGGR